MAGHSKWSKVKRFKGAIDARRGEIFSKLSKEISIAAKSGGGDPDGNPRLRNAILAARSASMPNDHVERAIKRGTGEGTEAQHFDEITYEGYAPGGVASSIDEERIFELALEAGAEELTNQEDEYLIITAPDQLYAVAEALRKAGVTTESQKFTFIPDTTITVADESVAQQILRLCDALEDDDDVQNVYSNLEIPDEMLAKLPA